MIRESLLTDWLEPEPLSPLLMSEIAGDQPTILLSICGPAAPSLERTRAPPIQRKNGPRSWISRIKYERLDDPLPAAVPYPEPASVLYPALDVCEHAYREENPV